MWEITWPWIDRKNDKCSTLKEARRIITSSLNQDVIEQKVGNHEVVFIYYWTVLAIAKEIKEEPCTHSFHSSGPETCPECGKER